MARLRGPEELVRLAHIAREHYIERKTRVEIAEELSLSRFKVTRMLDEAVELGIIRFEIASTGPIDVEASLALQRRFGLERATVVHTPSPDPTVVQVLLGQVAADLLSEVATSEDVLGLTAGRTLGRMAHSLSSLPVAEVVQLAGVAGPVQSSGADIMRRVSSLAECPGWTLYAPLIASDPSAAEAIRRQHDVTETYRQFDRVTLAMVAIGSWAPPDSEFYDNPAITPAARRGLLARGVQADIGAILLDRDGEVVDDVGARCVGVDAAQLHRIPDVIGVAGGARKVSAIRAAITSGLVTSLVTDTWSATQLLAPA